MSEQDQSPIAPQRGKRIHSLIIAGVLVAVLLFAWFRYDDGVAATTAGQAQTLADRTGAPADRYAAIAKGQVDLDGGIIRLAASRDGLIRDVLVNEGDFVRKGQVLLAMDDQQARLQLEQAQNELSERRAAIGPLRARLAIAEREAARLAPLATVGAVARQEFDELDGQVKVLQAEIVSAQAAVGSAESNAKVAAYEVEQRLVRAPLDGQIVRRQARPGDGISTLNVTSLFLFAPDSPRIIRADLEERFVSVVKPGMQTEIVLQADEAQMFRGKVLRIGRVFGQRSRPSDDPADKADVRTVECVLSIENQELLIGQRVIVRILPQ